MELTGVRHYCQLFNPGYFAIIERPDAESDWSIQTAKPPRLEGDFSDAFNFFLDLPGNLPHTDASFNDLYEIEVGSSTDNEVRLDFTIKKPKQETFFRFDAIIDEFSATFAKEQKWRPSKMDRHFTQDFWYCADFDNWKLVGDVPVPHTIKEFPDRERLKAPFLEIQISELRRVSSDEVIETCKLSHYGLPELNMRPPGNRKSWLYTSIFLMLVGAAIIHRVLRRKGATKAER